MNQTVEKRSQCNFVVKIDDVHVSDGRKMLNETRDDAFAAQLAPRVKSARSRSSRCARLRPPQSNGTVEHYFSLSFSLPSALFSSRNVRSCGTASSSRTHCS